MITALWAPHMTPPHHWIKKGILYHDRLASFAVKDDPSVQRLSGQLGELYEPVPLIAAESDAERSAAVRSELREALEDLARNADPHSNTAMCRWVQCYGSEHFRATEAELAALRCRIMAGSATDAGDSLDFIWAGKLGGIDLASLAGLGASHDPADTRGELYYGPREVLSAIYQVLVDRVCSKKTGWALSCEHEGLLTRSLHEEGNPEADALRLTETLPFLSLEGEGLNHEAEIDALLEFRDKHDCELRVLRAYTSGIVGGGDADSSRYETARKELASAIEHYEYGTLHAIRRMSFAHLIDETKNAVEGMALTGASAIAMGNGAAAIGVAAAQSVEFGLTGAAVWAAVSSVRGYSSRRRIKKGPFAYVLKAAIELQDRRDGKLRQPAHSVTAV